MRFLLFLFFIHFSIFAQLSKTTSYTSPSQIETASFSYSEDQTSYIASSSFLPTGALTKGISVMKRDQCGNVLWNNTYFLPSEILNLKQILTESNGENIFIIGYKEKQGTGKKELYVLKLNSDGEVEFSKTYEFGDFLYGNIYENYSSKGHIVIHGKFPKIGGGFSHGALIEIGTNGNIINSNKYIDSFTGLSTIKMSEESFLVRTASYLYLTHVDGTVYWAKQFDEMLQGSNFFQGQKNKNGNVFIIGRQKEYYLVKFSDQGEVVWKTEKLTFEFWPQLSVNKKNQLVLVANIFHNSAVKPLVITYNTDGELLTQEIINDLGTSVNNYPSVNNTPLGDISALYIASNSQELMFSENVSNSNCLELINLSEIPHSKSTSFSNISIQSTKMPVSLITDWALQVEKTVISDSIRCEPIIIEDTIFYDAKIDCDHSYFYSDKAINSMHYWPQDGSTDAYKNLDSAGVYTLIVENCHSRTIKLIEVEDICGCKLQIPNIFTPNNDQYNNTFNIQDICQTTNFEISIYDRWGKNVFTSQSVDNSWDGRYNGDLVPSGMYVYKIVYRPFSIIDNIPFETTEGAFLITY